SKTFGFVSVDRGCLQTVVKHNPWFPNEGSFNLEIWNRPPDIQQQAEHLLHEYELDDESLQKAQLEHHKIFPNFPTSPAAAAPSAAPPLRMGAKPKVPSIHGQDDSDNDSSEALFDMKADDIFF
ncbi:hypothetical protein Celaphus_00008423, partial [Cervus elaphus hippelaphus]